MAKKLKLPPMQTPCSACQQNPKHGGNALIVVCPHNEAVAILSIKDGLPSDKWQIFTPCTLADFAEIVKAQKQKLK